jgi:hypothetical protein
MSEKKRRAIRELGYGNDDTRRGSGSSLSLLGMHVYIDSNLQPGEVDIKSGKYRIFMKVTQE